MVMVTQAGAQKASGKTAALARYTEYGNVQESAYNFVSYSTPEECLEALKSGEVKQAVINAFSAENLLTKARYRGYTRVALQDKHVNVCSAVNDKLNPAVYNVLNRAINYISKSQINDICISNTLENHKMNFSTLLDQLPADVMAFLVILFLLGFLGVLVALFALINGSKKVNKLLYYDTLTGALTEYGFLQKAQTLLAKSEQHFYIVDFDVNRFSIFNCLQGKEAGDKLLQRIVRVTLQNAKEVELCARIYADHFVCLVQIESVCALLETIALREKQFGSEQDTLAVSLKYGIYEIKDPGISVRQMMDCALSAKQRIVLENETHYQVYNEEFYKKTLMESALLKESEKAFAENEFLAYYQPKFNAQTKQLVAAEALVRWQKPNGEMIPPYRFIELFEKNGKIRRLDFYMLQKVCEYQQALLAAGTRCVPISVNFSGLHFYDTDFAARINEIVSAYGLEKKLIEIEFTETEMIRNVTAAQKVFLELRQMGFTITMDDFGSGYSSLNSLKDIPVDIVKLDRGFFLGADNLEKSKLIVQSVIALAGQMHLTTVAEGIETQEQYDFVRECGCDMIQGYYFSKPITAQDFCEKLQAAAKEPLSV